jgi:hypothetical protein
VSEPVRFPFLDAVPGRPGYALMPLLPVTLSYGETSISHEALVDSGAAVSVLPYSIGFQLGLDWERSPNVVLTGNLARITAKGIIVSGAVGFLPPVRLVFAWTQSDDVRMIVGQANFFMEFDVCLFRSRQFFEIAPKRQH